MAIEIVNKNGAPQPVRCKTHGRIYQVTPDGSQWEVRVYLESDLGQGDEIIGEVTFRSFNGGIQPLMALAAEAPKLAAQLINRVGEQLEHAQRRVVPATAKLPPELRRN